MSRLTALAKVSSKGLSIPNAIERVSSGGKVAKAAYLGAGVAGGILGFRSGLNAGQETYHSLSPEEKTKYHKAYGKDAKKIYSHKQAIRGAITGAMSGYQTAEGLHGLVNMGRAAHLEMKSSTYQKHGTRMVAKHGKLKGNYLYYRRISKAKGYLEDRKLRGKQQGGFTKLIADGAIGFAKHYAVDKIAEYGPSNLYGEAMKHVYHRYNQRGKSLAKTGNPYYAPKPQTSPQRRKASSRRSKGGNR